MTKFKIFLNYGKEEKWLELMAAQGYQLKKASLVYSFDSASPEQVSIRIDYRHFKNNRDFVDYCSLFEDGGWRHIVGTKNSGAQYFKKAQGADADDIFSDAASRAGRYKRLADMMMSISIAFIIILLPMLLSDSFQWESFLNPKALYLTPGLWEMSGPTFWRHFWFETPFALMRGFGWLFWLLFVFAYVFFAVKSWALYKKTLKQDAIE